MVETFNTLALTEKEKTYGTIILQRLQDHFSPKSNQSVERHKFNNRVQGANETFDNFIKDLKTIVASCGYGNMKNDLIRDKIVSNPLPI